MIATHLLPGQRIAPIGAILLALILLVCGGCSRTDQQPGKPTGPQAAQGKGVVRGIDSDHRAITLDHEKIPNIAEASTKGFKVEDATLLQDVVIGDTVLFSLKEAAPGDFVITSLEPFGFNPLMESRGGAKSGGDTGKPSSTKTPH